MYAGIIQVYDHVYSKVYNKYYVHAIYYAYACMMIKDPLQTPHVIKYTASYSIISVIVIYIARKVYTIVSRVGPDK